jgi:hypothetical protein
MKKNQENKKLYSLLSCQTKSILVGSILGDGSLKKKSKGPNTNANFAMKHSIKQKDYFMWKRNQICLEISANIDVWKQTDKAPSGTMVDKLRYQSGARPSLTYLHDLVHKGSIKGEYRIRRKFLNMLTPLSLAIWWCDDGSLVSNTRQGVFCTDGFTYKDMLVLDRYMKKVLHINTSIHALGLKKNNIFKKDGTKRYRLWIRSRDELKKFLKIILPHIPVSSMLYKAVLLYKDSELQQRWISEITNLTQYSEKEINNIVLERKQNLKHFSENDIVRVCDDDVCKN